MAPTADPAATLLTELVRHGIELQPRGDRLRYRPRSALTPELARRVKAYKPALLAILRPDHEWSLAERVALGYVNPGWTPAAWADRLGQLADRCEALRPELAAQYRTWAANVRKNREEVV